MKFHLGAYYLIKQRKYNYGYFDNLYVLNSNMGINISLLDTWSFSWTDVERTTSDVVKKILSINKERMASIQEWSDVKITENKIGWPNTFANLETLIEYKESFFECTNNYEAISIYFSEDQKHKLLTEIINGEIENEGEVGIKINLQSDLGERFGSEIEIGFDLVCMEFGGSFYSFHQYNITEKLIDKFGISINKYGLIENVSSWEEILDFMNEEIGEYFPYSWHYVKVKKYCQ